MIGYLISYLATPVCVKWSVGGVMKFMDEVVSRDPSGDAKYYVVSPVEIEDFKDFLIREFKTCGDLTPEGERKPIVPDENAALDWAASEIGEAFGARQNSIAMWRRNHQDAHLLDNLDFEIGQAIMMLCLAHNNGDWLMSIMQHLKKWHWEDHKLLENPDVYNLIEERYRRISGLDTD